MLVNKPHIHTKTRWYHDILFLVLESPKGSGPTQPGFRRSKARRFQEVWDGNTGPPSDASWDRRKKRFGWTPAGLGPRGKSTVNLSGRKSQAVCDLGCENNSKFREFVVVPVPGDVTRVTRPGNDLESRSEAKSDLVTIGLSRLSRHCSGY